MNRILLKESTNDPTDGNFQLQKKRDAQTIINQLQMLTTFNLENADKEVPINSEKMNEHIKRMASSNYLGDTKYMQATRKDFDTQNNF